MIIDYPDCHAHQHRLFCIAKLVFSEKENNHTIALSWSPTVTGESLKFFESLTASHKVQSDDALAAN